MNQFAAFCKVEFSKDKNQCQKCFLFTASVSLLKGLSPLNTQKVELCDGYERTWINKTRIRD